MADDHTPHLSQSVANLCWGRGYVFIPHGGGVTLVAQTVDTDLNQAVKARYQALEAAALVRLMRDGIAVPHLTPVDCVDLMVEVLSDMSLHHVVAGGNIKTGLRVPLDSSDHDHFIVQEAAIFWKELNMRQKVNAAAAEVREEVKQGRVSWCLTDIKRLILAYPRHKHVDAALADLGGGHGLGGG